MRRRLGIAIVALLVVGVTAALTTDPPRDPDSTLELGAAAASPASSDPDPTSSIPSTTSAATPATTAAPTTTTTTEPPVEALVTPVAADDPAGLAEQIVAAETKIRDPETTPDALANAALLQQVVYRQLGRHPEWDEAVLAAVPETIHLSVQRNAQARREFRGMHSKLQENMPPWRIIEPVPAADLLRFYKEAEAEFGIKWQYLASINLVETGMGRIRGTSVAGAQGPMQFIPSTWDAFGEGDINDPRDAIFAAARYLNHNGGHEGNIDGALFRYNNHNNYVRGVKAYADVMFEDPQMFFGFYNWQVVYLTVRGDIILFPGYEELERVPVDEYLARPSR